MQKAKDAESFFFTCKSLLHLPPPDTLYVHSLQKEGAQDDWFKAAGSPIPYQIDAFEEVCKTMGEGML